jgi:hypothetical protein
MPKTSIKLILPAVVLLIGFFLFMRSSRPLEKYRERRDIDLEAVAIDVCLDKGEDARKISAVLNDAWQRLRDLHNHPSPQEAMSRAQRILKKAGVSNVDERGITKGYVLDEATAIIRQHGYRNFLIDAGPDVIASGKNCEHKPWTIAIKNPRDARKIIDIIQIQNSAVSSWVPNQVQRIASATVIAPTVLESNILAQTINALGSKQGIARINALGKKFAVMAVDHDAAGKAVMDLSSSYKQFQIKKHSR